MKRKFEFEFEDQSSECSISFDYDEAFTEKMQARIENGVPVIYANRQALLSLAKTFTKMALCNYPVGLHVHLRNDFDADKSEALRVIIDEE